jgi:hypothetical protein
MAGIIAAARMCLSILVPHRDLSLPRMVLGP